MFSEELFDINHFKQVNLTYLNENIDQVIEIEYICLALLDADTEASIIPQLLNYRILVFTNEMLVLKLNYSDPIYVSSF